MRIAIMGAGNVGGGLAAACTAVGHEVVFGVRDPASLKTMTALAALPEATATSPAEAVEGADLIVFALRWDAVSAIVAGLPSLAGRMTTMCLSNAPCAPHTRTGYPAGVCR